MDLDQNECTSNILLGFLLPILTLKCMFDFSIYT